MTTDNKQIKEDLKRCKNWSDYEKIIGENGFVHTRTTGGHKLYTKNGCRTIPISTHGKPPEGSLKARLIKQILGFITVLTFLFFIML